MTAVTFPLRLPRLAFAICGWRWQNDMHEIKYSVCLDDNRFIVLRGKICLSVCLTLKRVDSLTYTSS